MKKSNDPFQNPRPLNQPPYWLQDFNQEVANKHVSLMKMLEELERENPESKHEVQDPSQSGRS